MSVIGAVFGTLLVNFAKTFFSEEYPDLWLFLMGATFIAVVLLFPDGLAGLYERYGKPFFLRLIRKKKEQEPAVPVAAMSGGKHG
jgi:urea transport system permease protein